MVISVSSRKSKSRRLQNYTAQKISDLLDIPWGKDESIAAREMGQAGTDVRLVGDVQQKFPFSIECKYQETWSIPSWIKQAKENQKDDTDWLLVCKKNRKKPVVIIDAEVFFALYRRILND